MFIVNGVSGASLHCINFGVAMEKEDGSGIGIKNVKEVLKMMYQQDHLLYFENLEPEGTKITIWIPKTLKCTDEEKDEER